MILGQEEKPPLDEDTLAHYGVLGMRWGHHKDGLHLLPGTRTSMKVGRKVGNKIHDHRVDNAARKHAAEFARAKMFYGEGAGTRRKLIKAKVEANSKNPAYKKAFDRHLANQDLGQHANKAQSERKRKNAAKSVGKTARGINRAVTGPFGSTVTVTALMGAYGYAHARGLDKKLVDNGAAFIRKMSTGTPVDLSFLKK